MQGDGNVVNLVRNAHDLKTPVVENIMEKGVESKLIEPLLNLQVFRFYSRLVFPLQSLYCYVNGEASYCHRAGSLLPPSSSTHAP